MSLAHAEDLEPVADASPLTAFAVGETARVAGFQTEVAKLEDALREIGFAEGDEVEIIRKGPYGDVLAVRVGRAQIGLRHDEAAAVLAVAS